MFYRTLGRSGLRVGAIGLGAEYLEHEPAETVTAVVHEALDHGVNYIDLFMATPGVRDNFGLALRGRAEEVLIAGHLGAIHQDGQYAKSRDKALCEAFVDDLLRRVGLDSLGVLMLHFVDEQEDYERVFAPDGLLEAAMRLKEKGKARCLGMSSHAAPAALQAVDSGYIDVLMFPVNPLFDRLPGATDLDAMWKTDPYQQVLADGRILSERDELYRACARHDVGIVAMKPYAAGWLFAPDNAFGLALSPVQCLHYALSQPGVAVAVPGCKNAEQMRAALAYLEAGEAERDYGFINASPLWRERKACMYCNHCLPCPAGLDIGALTRLGDAAGRGLTATLLEQYDTLAVGASACTDCGLCRKRCPFGVDPAANMRRAAGIFGR